MIKTLRDIIEKVAIETLEYESDIIERNLDERCIQFRLGLYLNRLLIEKGVLEKGYKLDAEYNKNGEDTKKVYKACKAQDSNINCIQTGCFIISNDLINYQLKETEVNYVNKIYSFVKLTYNNKYMRPDYILHKRTQTSNSKDDNDNLLCIEIKTNNNQDKHEIVKDYAKLTYLTCPMSEYQFQLGVHIFIDYKAVHLTYFTDGVLEQNASIIKTFTEI